MAFYDSNKGIFFATVLLMDFGIVIAYSFTKGFMRC